MKQEQALQKKEDFKNRKNFNIKQVKRHHLLNHLIAKMSLKNLA